MAVEPDMLSAEDMQFKVENPIGTVSADTVNDIREGNHITSHSPVNGVEKETSDGVNSEVDAEGEEVDDEYTDTYTGDVMAVETPISEVARDAKPSVVRSPSDSDASSVEEEEDTDSTGSSSGTEGQWAVESDAVDEAELDASEGTRCIFCNQDEDHDPNVDFEECLDCIVCGNIAHRKCARDAALFDDETDPERWRCSDCVANGLEEEPKLTSQKTRRRSSAPRLTRDLLPSHRGSVKPDSHSVFNTLILDDDPMDGSRSLRKRRKSGEDMDDLTGSEAKKQRYSIESSVCLDDIKGSDKSATKESDLPTSTVVAEESVVESTALQISPEIPRSSRRQRMRKQDKASVTIKRPGRFSMIASFRLDAAKLQKILKPGSRRRRRIVRERPKDFETTPEEPSHYPALQMSSFINPLFASYDRASDDMKSKPYGGILSEAEADTSKTFPLAVDRSKFENARQKAEEDWKQKVATMNTYSEPVRIVQKAAGPPSKIRCINFGGYEIDTWHAAPYPEEYSRNKVLYICEFCLKYMSSDYVAWRHNLKCAAKHPPGDEIYRDGKFSFFEVDGRKNPVYCQNLCLLAKLFLGSKTLYYDVEPFLFYIMTENDEYGCHFVGYFSKEKRPSSLNNVSCILVLPIHQRRGFGHFLIDFSYQLTRVERKAGSPEKPLSDMGLVSYRSYWRLVLCNELLKQKSPVSITELSERTGMTADDIISALEALRALARDPETGTYALRIDYDYLKQYVESYERKSYCKINPDALIWTPYVMGHNDLAHYEEGPSLQTVAPREDDQQTAKDAEEGVQMEEHISKLGERDETMASEELGLDGEDDQLQQQLHQEAQPAMQTSDHSLQAVSDSTQPSTPMMNGGHERATLNGSDMVDRIPPTRFQVWPPIQKRIVSTATRRRAGRPFGSRRRTFTPARRRANRISYASPKSAIRSSMARRQKSKLGEIDGVDDHNAQKVNNIPQVEAQERKTIVSIIDGEATNIGNASTDQQMPNGVAVSTETPVNANADPIVEQDSLVVNGIQPEDTLMENG